MHFTFKNNYFQFMLKATERFVKKIKAICLSVIFYFVFLHRFLKQVERQIVN